jgi:hypothetical protein
VLGVVFRLRYFFEYGSSACLWAANDAARTQFGYECHSAQLPLPDTLRDRIVALTAQFQSSLDWNDPGGASPWTRGEASAFREACDELLTDLRNALGAQFEVIDER